MSTDEIMATVLLVLGVLGGFLFRSKAPPLNQIQAATPSPVPAFDPEPITVLRSVANESADPIKPPAASVPFTDIFQREGDRFGIDWRLLAAIAWVESSFRPAAINDNEPNGKRSMGLMQILVPQKLYLDGWSGRHPVGGDDSLLDAAVNVHLGAGILHWNLKTYGYPRGVAVYNAYSARTSPINGPFPNQGYVAKVLGKFEQLGGDSAALARRWNS